MNTTPVHSIDPLAEICFWEVQFRHEYLYQYFSQAIGGTNEFVVASEANVVESFCAFHDQLNSSGKVFKEHFFLSLDPLIYSHGWQSLVANRRIRHIKYSGILHGKPKLDAENAALES